MIEFEDILLGLEFMTTFTTTFFQCKTTAKTSKTKSNDKEEN